MRIAMFSAPIIRYLITLNKLDNKNGIRCVDIAENMNLSKPTVHTMMEEFAQKGLVNKVRYGMVFLTRTGRELSEQYSGYYAVSSRFLNKRLALPPEDADNAAVAILAGISTETNIKDMCNSILNLS